MGTSLSLSACLSSVLACSLASLAIRKTAVLTRTHSNLGSADRSHHRPLDPSHDALFATVSPKAFVCRRLARGRAVQGVRETQDQGGVGEIDEWEEAATEGRQGGVCDGRRGQSERWSGGWQEAEERVVVRRSGQSWRGHAIPHDVSTHMGGLRRVELREHPSLCSRCLQTSSKVSEWWDYMTKRKSETMRKRTERNHAEEKCGLLSGSEERRRRRLRPVWPLRGRSDGKAVDSAWRASVVRSAGLPVSRNSRRRRRESLSERSALVI